jgi:hypothetical protein
MPKTFNANVFKQKFISSLEKAHRSSTLVFSTLMALLKLPGDGVVVLECK